VCGVSVAIFLLLQTKGPKLTLRDLSAMGAPQAYEIWNGKYWALFTSAFVHASWWHLAFNLYWTWLLGRVLERALGSWKFLAYFLSAAAVSAGTELAFTTTTGIGLSGVLYGIFGFLWMRREFIPGASRVLPPATIRLLLLWLVLCFGLTAAKVLMIANGAHVGGLLFGVLVGLSAGSGRARRLARLGAAAIALASLLPLFWCPWSSLWVADRAYEAHRRGDVKSAVRGYERSLEMGLDAPWTLQNLTLAYEELGDHTRSAAALRRLREVDPHAADEVEKKLAAGSAR